MSILNCMLLAGAGLFAGLMLVAGVAYVAMELDYRWHVLPARRVSEMLKRSEGK